MNDTSESGLQSLKHYVVLANDIQKALLSNLIPGLQFMEVEGIAVPNLSTHVVLVNPLPEKKEISDLLPCQS